jgi:tRNA dimethylallyltransferase
MPAARAPVVFIVGPTASGKTAAAIALARALAGHPPAEAVNADSRQVYRGMSIGTAKPTPAEQAALPHHLVDIASPQDGYSLAAFLDAARAAIADIQGRGAFPIVVGGTGQYVWGLAEGWQVPRVPPDPALRARLEAAGPAALHARLAEVDPSAAEAIGPRNTRRLVRALEVWEATGVPFSAQRQRTVPPFEPLLFGLRRPRAELYRRIDQRVDAMLAAGWLDEVRALLVAGCTPGLPAFSSVGYRELAAHIFGEVSLEEAVQGAKNASHRLARSQDGWFRADDPRITWCTGEERLVAAAAEAVRERLT